MEIIQTSKGAAVNLMKWFATLESVWIRYGNVMGKKTVKMVLMNKTVLVRKMY